MRGRSQVLGSRQPIVPPGRTTSFQERLEAKPATENEHFEKLRIARAQTVEGRRNIAARLASAYEEGEPEELRE